MTNFITSGRPHPGLEYAVKGEVAKLRTENERLRSALHDMIEISKRNSSPEIILTEIRTCAADALSK